MTHTAPTVRPMMHKVHSSNIDAVGFMFTSLDAGQVWVRFLSADGKPGPTWRYDNCTRAEYDQLYASKSIGSHFHAHIKGKKQGARVD